jgi:hypothetical protein
VAKEEHGTLYAKGLRPATQLAFPRAGQYYVTYTIQPSMNLTIPMLATRQAS